MSARPKAVIESEHRKTASASVLKPSGPVKSPLGFQSQLRGCLGCKFGTQEGQQVGIYGVGLGGRAAVREVLVGL